MNKFIAITIGDINGIGIHILLDAWKNKKIKNFVLLSDVNVIKKFIKSKKYSIKLNIINTDKNNIQFDKNKLNIYSYKSSSLEDNTYKSLRYSYYFSKNLNCLGIITLPLRKDLIKKKIDNNFVGQTEFFQKISKKKYANMIMFHNNIIISPLTTHIELKNIPKIISNKSFIVKQILNLNNTLKIDFNIQNPKLIISGVNPHAGENGNIGLEEKKFISPSIERLKKLGININGPVSADSMLIKNNLKKYDCFVFIYHDQGLIPFKFISQFTGVNYTGNLNIIRTSPDHGTAYDMIGSKSISNNSLINCFKLIKKINKNRANSDKS
tara:strand:+ start:473 stop:1447 length:975 start_codon:yes stop_codon:yes gene_type:complete